MTNNIPLLDLDPELDMLWDEINEALQKVLRSGRFIMGPEVNGFEQRVADYLGTKHAVGVNSGTDALVIGLRAVGVGAGDEVITSPFSFFATAESISIVGATPIFIDIVPTTFNIDPALIEEKITPKTKAIIPVHLYGHSADMDAIMAIAKKHDLKVVEDTAQAFGGTYGGHHVGTIGEVGAYSFFPSKNLGAYGDGGLVTTDDDAVAEEARMLRTHGAKKKYQNLTVGYNSRLDAMQAAVLNVKLNYLDEFNAGRRRVANRYCELLADEPLVILPTEIPPAYHVYHQFTVRILDGHRDRVKKTLKEQGISTMIYYPTPIHKLPVYEDMNVTLDMSEQLTDEVLSLPIWPQMDDDTQDRVVEALKMTLKETTSRV